MLWFTGLSGSGKSTIANTLEKRLHALGRHTYMLDGDNVRHGLNKDLGFTDADRVENIRRVAEAARLFVDAGLIVMVSFISPFRSERRMARELVGEGEFIEIFVDTPLEVCEARDPKGLYRKARAGLIRNFTGIDSSYEPPEQAELALSTSDTSPEALGRDAGRRAQASPRRLASAFRRWAAPAWPSLAAYSYQARGDGGVGIDAVDAGMIQHFPVIGEGELVGGLGVTLFRQACEQTPCRGELAFAEQHLGALV